MVGRVTRPVVGLVLRARLRRLPKRPAFPVSSWKTQREFIGTGNLSAAATRPACCVPECSRGPSRGRKPSASSHGSAPGVPEGAGPAQSAREDESPRPEPDRRVIPRIAEAHGVSQSLSRQSTRHDTSRPTHGPHPISRRLAAHSWESGPFILSDDPADHGLSAAEVACIEQAYEIRRREVRAALMQPSPFEIDWGLSGRDGRKPSRNG